MAQSQNNPYLHLVDEEVNHPGLQVKGTKEQLPFTTITPTNSFSIDVPTIQVVLDTTQHGQKNSHWIPPMC